jgi:hypothetical protein
MNGKQIINKMSGYMRVMALAWKRVILDGRPSVQPYFGK